MGDTRESVDVAVATVMEELFKLDSPPIDKNRDVKIRDFVKLTINGDTPQKHLTINAGFGNDKEGAIVYILTNARLIEIDIDAKEVQSSSFFLDKITSVERKLLDGDRAQIKISFTNDSFGLRYENTDQKIADFFQAIDQFRGTKESSHG